MEDLYRIEMLPALHGDCILVEYGDRASPHRVLIDGGPPAAYPMLERRILQIPEGQRRFELVVVTHIDSDHIGGIVRLLNRKELGVSVDQLWFNGWPQVAREISDEPHVPPPAGRKRSAREGIYLELRAGNLPWNRSFGGGAIYVPTSGDLPECTTPGGLRLTLLSPNAAKLRVLQKHWLQWFATRGVRPEDRKSLEGRLSEDRRYREAAPFDTLEEALKLPLTIDAAAANGSSIAFVAEYRGKRCAFLADAHVPVLEQSIRRLRRKLQVERLPLDAVKLAHHGSAANLSEPFLNALDARSFLVSTDGSIFGHPDDAAIARVIETTQGARLFFNYRSARNLQWQEPGLQHKHGFSCFYPPEGGEAGISLEL